MGMGVSQQRIPEHAVAPSPGVVTTAPAHLSSMEQKEEQPVMMLPLPPSSVP
jgi:hypothetical protein